MALYILSGLFEPYHEPPHITQYRCTQHRVRLLVDDDDDVND